MQNDECTRQTGDLSTTDGATPQPAQMHEALCRASESVPATRTPDDSPGGSPSPSPSPSLPHKKSGRGMSMRRRIGLKIEADERDGTPPHSRRSGSDGDTADADKEAQLRPLNHTGDTDEHTGAAVVEEWWKLEYRAPPPGHLGAHAIARDDEHKSPSSRTRHHLTIEATERKLERMDVTGTTAFVTTAVVTPVTAASPVERLPLHETPERARKVRGGSELYDAVTSHSSPNPKRKIMDLQDLEAGTFPSMGVAKEPKRFHETNGALLVEGESELSRTLRAAVVTPSKLLRPMKKIDIQAGSASPSLEKVVSSTAKGVGAKASESA